MGIALKLSDSTTLLSLAQGKKFLCLVTLLAVRNGADRLRFLRRSGAWSISARARIGKIMCHLTRRWT